MNYRKVRTGRAMRSWLWRSVRQSRRCEDSPFVWRQLLPVITQTIADRSRFWITLVSDNCLIIIVDEAVDDISRKILKVKTK